MNFLQINFQEKIYRRTYIIFLVKKKSVWKKKKW